MADSKNLNVNNKRIADGFPGARHVNIPPDIVGKAANSPVSKNLFPTSIGFFSFADGHYFDRPKGIDENIVIGCISGSGKCKIGDKEWQLKGNELIFLPKSTPHAYESCPVNPWTIMWCHYVGEQCSDYHQSLNISANAPLMRVSSISELMTSFEEVYELTQTGYSRKTQFGLSASLGRFLSQCALYRRSLNAPRRQTEEKIYETVMYMKKNLHRRIALSDLAMISGLTPTYYSQLFKINMEIAPIELLAELRMQEACNKLKTTSDSISKISASLGYSDAFYFSKVFRKHQKISPSHYRKKFQIPSN